MVFYIGNCGDINLVRLGPEKSINTEVLRFSLDNQVSHRMSKSDGRALNLRLTLEAGALGTPSVFFPPEKDQPSHVQEMHRRKECLDRLLDELSRQRALFRGARKIQVPVWPFACIIYAQGVLLGCSGISC